MQQTLLQCFDTLWVVPITLVALLAAFIISRRATPATKAVTKSQASALNVTADDSSLASVKHVLVDQTKSASETHSYIHDLHKQHGDLFVDNANETANKADQGKEGVIAADAKPILYSSNPQTAAFVLTKGKFFQPVRCPDSAFVSFTQSERPDVKARTPFDLVQPMAKGTVFDIVGDDWKAKRMCLAPLFTATEDVTNQFAEAAKELLPDLIKVNGGTVDTQVFSYMIFVKGTLNLLFGNELTLPQSCWEKFEEGIKHFQAETSFSSDDHVCYTKCIYEPCEVAVEWALKNEDKCPPNCAFTRMMAKGFDGKAELIATTANFVVAAAESPASAMAHSVALVCGDPKVQAKMTAEINEALKASDGEMNKSFCKDLKYVDAVIQESMRVKAPATMVSREAIDDVVMPVGDGKKLAITKGTKVNLCIHAVHLRDDVWGEDCEEFNPERWLVKDEKGKVEGLTYMPFSAGTRGCPGKAISIMWMKVLFALILKDYDLSESTDNEGGVTTSAAADTAHLNKHVSWIPTGIYATFKEHAVVTEAA
jgi:cytochrome P450